MEGVCLLQVGGRVNVGGMVKVDGRSEVVEAAGCECFNASHERRPGKYIGQRNTCITAAIT